MAAAVAEATTSAAQLENAVMHELVRLAELNSAQQLSQAAFHTAAAAVRKQLRTHSQQLEQLTQLAAEQEVPAEREETLRHVRRHRAEAAALAESLRELGVRVNASRAKQEAVERAALLLGADGTDAAEGARQAQLSDREAVRAARAATDSFRRMRELMAKELQRSDQTLISLETQSKTLKDAEARQHGVHGSLGTSRRALTRLQLRDFTDKVLLLLSFAFFVLVVLHIVLKRLGSLTRAATAGPALLNESCGTDELAEAPVADQAEVPAPGLADTPE